MHTPHHVVYVGAAWKSIIIQRSLWTLMTAFKIKAGNVPPLCQIYLKPSCWGEKQHEESRVALSCPSPHKKGDQVMHSFNSSASYSNTSRGKTEKEEWMWKKINLFRPGLTCIDRRWQNMRWWLFTYYFPPLHVLKNLHLVTRRDTHRQGTDNRTMAPINFKWQIRQVGNNLTSYSQRWLVRLIQSSGECATD